LVAILKKFLPKSAQNIDKYMKLEATLVVMLILEKIYFDRESEWALVILKATQHLRSTGVNI